MDFNSPIPVRERDYLRELAKKQLEYSKLPQMLERKKLWTLHNRLEGKRPMVVMEEETFAADILPPAFCEHPVAAVMERRLNQVIAAHEIFDDDKVVPDFFPVYLAIDTDFLGQKQKRTFASSGPGFHIDPVFETVGEGLPLLRPSRYVYNKVETETYEKAARDVLGDILPVVRKNSFNYWFIAITQHVLDFMGMENMYCSIMTEPDNFHKLMRIVTEDLLRCLRWQEENGLILPNCGNDWLGAGSFCFSDELECADACSVPSVSRHTWGHLNSEESIGLSPEQFDEFIYPYYETLAREFGLLYFGCCEPVHVFWDRSLCRLPNLRKISISLLCNEEIMGERLAGSGVIYSRKPTPNFLGVRAEFDEEAFTAYIKKTAAVIKGRCKAEFIFRDIYTLHGNREKIRRAVEITRHIAEDMY